MFIFYYSKDVVVYMVSSNRIEFKYYFVLYRYIYFHTFTLNAHVEQKYCFHISLPVLSVSTLDFFLLKIHMFNLHFPTVAETYNTLL